MPITSLAPQGTNLGAILGGGQGNANSLMALLNFLFQQGGAGRRPLTAGTTGGFTGARRPLPASFTGAPAQPPRPAPEFPFAPVNPTGTIAGFLDTIKGKLAGSSGVQDLSTQAINRGEGFTGGISFAPGTSPKERTAAEGALSPPTPRFRGGISFAPGTGIKERTAASDTLGRILGGGGF